MEIWANDGQIVSYNADEAERTVRHLSAKLVSRAAKLCGGAISEKRPRGPTGAGKNGRKRLEIHSLNPHFLGLRALRNHYYAMRHGQSEANVLGVAVGDPRRGVRGFGLTEVGRQQAVVSAAEFKENYTPSANGTEIVSSDFLRTRETAELLSKQLGNTTPVRLSERLRERSFGELEGMEHRHMAVLLEREGLARLIERYGCEPAASVQSRVVSIIRDLEQENRDKTLILVSHADPIQFLMAVFAGLDMNDQERILPLNCAEIAELKLGMPVRFKEDEAG